MLLAVDFQTIRQLTVDGFFRGCSYGLLGIGFALILGVTGRFHFAYGFTYTLAAYLAYTLTFRGWTWPYWPSAIVGILLAACVGAAMELFIYRPLAKRAGATALLAVFVAALGLGIAGGNMISLLYSESTLRNTGVTKRPYHVWDTVFLNFDVWQGATAFVIAILLALMLRYTALGRRIKATRVNPDLARTIGINADTTYVICFFLGTICAGVAALFYSMKFPITPSMGTTPVIYAFVVAFLAGTARSPIRVLIVGILVALVEQYASIWLSVRWTQTAVFVILVGYLTVLAIRSSAWAARVRIPGLRRA